MTKQEPMSPEQFLAKMQSLFRDNRPTQRGDRESAHISADSLMCELLASLGYTDGVRVFENSHKWYS